MLPERPSRTLFENFVRAILFASLSGCFLLRPASAEDLPRVTPIEAGLSAAKLERVRSVVQAAVDENQTAGVVFLIARHGKVVYLECFGKMDLEAGKSIAPDPLFR